MRSGDRTMRDDPFTMARFGGSPKTVIGPALSSTNDTTLVTTTRMDENGNCSADPDKKSFSEQQMVMPFLFGENSSTKAGNKASTAQSSETKARTSHRFLSDRLTLLLINAGLVKGITHTSARKRLEAKTPALVSSMLIGDGAERQRVDCLF